MLQGLAAELVTAHLAMALTVLAAVIFIAERASNGPMPAARPRPVLTRLVMVTAVAIFAQMLLGSWVTGQHAGLAFGDIPLMDGSVVPTIGSETQAIHARAPRDERGRRDPRGLDGDRHPSLDGRPAPSAPRPRPRRARRAPDRARAGERRVEAVRALRRAAPRGRRGDVGHIGLAPADRPAAAAIRDARPRRANGRARTDRHRPRLHRAHEAADHRAAARDDGPDDGPRRRRPAIAVARGRRDRRRHAGGRRGERDQHVRRSRHRRPHAPHPAPAAPAPRRRAAQRPCTSASA